MVTSATHPVPPGRRSIEPLLDGPGRDLHTVPGGSTAPSGPTFTGNVSLGDARFVSPRDFLADADAEDYSPVSTLLTTLYANVFPYDARGVLRSASDCAGAWSKNAA